MERRIEGLHRDDAGDWVAELSCGHRRHVRDRPPFSERPWTRTAEAREQAVGRPLDCGRCDQLEMPEGFEPYRSTAEFDGETLPAALRARHQTKQGVWGLIHVRQGHIDYRILEPFDRRERLLPGRPGVVPPEVPHQLELDGPVSLWIELWRRAGSAAGTR